MTILTDLASIPQAVRVVAISPNDRVLLIQFREPHSGRVHWLPPGGGVEKGETLQEAMARELYEETGFRFEGDTQLIWTRYASFTWESKRFEQHEHYFLIRTPEFNPSSAHNADLSEASAFLAFKWWSAAELKQTADTLIPVNLSQLISNLLDPETNEKYPFVVI